MEPLTASKLLVVEGVEDDPRMKARADRLREAIPARETRIVDDAALRDVVATELTDLPRHGMRRDIEPVVILNRFRFDDDEAERQRRIEAYPELNTMKFNGYGGFDWRDSGTPAWRERTGLVCQPAWQLHTIVGCHYRCAYCFFGWFANLMMNTEEFVERLDANIARCATQTLFQYDNWTDTVCFEPEYGGATLLIDYFARRSGKALELYVGKSANVDFLLDYDHRGHTVCCWSLAARRQSRELERGSAPMAGRIDAMRKCQDAGYPVRVRFSPIIPVRDWEAENREMIARLFDQVEPDVVTIETIRFLNYDQMAACFDLDLLDPGFVAAMEAAPRKPDAQGCEVPDAWRSRVYDFVFEEVGRRSPDTPIAFCREKRALWDAFAQPFARWGQTPDAYLCNCGPFSHPATVQTDSPPARP